MHKFRSGVFSIKSISNDTQEMPRPHKHNPPETPKEAEMRNKYDLFKKVLSESRMFENLYESY